MSEKRELKDFHCRNERCRRVLGQTDEEWFYFVFPDVGVVGEVSQSKLDIRCLKCGFTTRWKRNQSKRAV